MAKRRFRVMFQNLWSQCFYHRYTTKEMGICWQFSFTPFKLWIGQYASYVIVLNFEISLVYPVVGSPADWKPVVYKARSIKRKK